MRISRRWIRPLLVALVVALLTACGAGSTAPSTDPVSTTLSSVTQTSPSLTSTPVGSPSATVELVPSALISTLPGVQVIEAKPFADWITVAGGSAWVANVADGVGRYDGATGALLGSVAVGSDICLGMDASADSLWVGECTTTTLVRVDLVTAAVVSTIDLPFDTIAAESSVAAGEGAVFVLSGDASPTIARIDPATNTVSSTFPAPPGASALRAGEGALWVSSDRQGTLTRLDPVTGATVATIPAAPGARFLAIGEGSVWVMSNNTGVVTRVDPVTNAVVASIPASPSSVDGGDIAVGGGYAWARVSDVLVAKIDPATNAVVARYGPRSGSGSVAADDRAVWISAHDVNTVWRVPLA